MMPSATFGSVSRRCARRFLAAAALAPPQWKTNGFYRLCAWLYRRAQFNRDDLVTSNLGISQFLRCAVPMSKDVYAFGQPRQVKSERATISLVLALLADCRCIVDVGANEGIFTFLAHDIYPTLRLHWFEPDRRLAERLRSNLAANGIDHVGNRCAVSDRTGDAVFFENATDDFSGSLTQLFADKHEMRAVPVHTIRLSDYFVEHAIENALVKIDVEGAGKLVWAGLGREFRSIRYLVMEMLAPEIEAGLPRRITEEAGFAAYYICDFDLVHSKAGDFLYVEPFWNWLFCRLQPEELAARLAGTDFRVVTEEGA